MNFDSSDTASSTEEALSLRESAIKNGVINTQRLIDTAPNPLRTYVEDPSDQLRKINLCFSDRSPKPYIIELSERGLYTEIEKYLNTLRHPIFFDFYSKKFKIVENGDRINFNKKINESTFKYQEHLNHYSPLVPQRVRHHHSTALHAAVKSGYSKIVYLLLKNGADPLYQDCYGKTPLDYATEDRRHNCVVLLRCVEKYRVC